MLANTEKLPHVIAGPILPRLTSDQLVLWLATSRPFEIQRLYIAFLIVGGPHEDTVGIELLIDGKRVRQATGPESEELELSPSI